jgi:hypothetical protein
MGMPLLIETGYDPAGSGNRIDDQDWIYGEVGVYEGAA